MRERTDAETGDEDAKGIGVNAVRGGDNIDGWHGGWAGVAEGGDGVEKRKRRAWRARRGGVCGEGQGRGGVK